MADNRIKLTIESLFKGEGFTKARDAVNGMSKSVKDATSAIRGISGELGGLQGPIGKAADGISKLLSSLTGGPIGIAVASIGLIVSAFNSWKEKVEETRQRQKELIEKMEEGYKKRIAEAIERARQKQIDFLDSLIKKGNDSIAVMQKLNASYRAVQESQRGLNAQQNTKAFVEIDYNTAVSSQGKTKEQQAVIQAEGELQKTKIKNKAAGEKAFNDMQDAQFEVDAVASEISQLKDVIKLMKQKGDDTSQKEVELQMANDKLAAARNKLALATNNNEIVYRQQQIAEIQANERLKEAKLAAAKVEQDIADKKKKEEEQAKAQAEAKRKKEEDEAAKKKIADQKKRFEEQKDEVKKQTKGEIDLVNYKTEQFKKMQSSGMASDAKYHDGIFGQYKYQLDANGNIRSFRDWKRTQRYADRGERDKDRAHRDTYKMDADEKKYDKLYVRSMAGKKISAKDEKFMEEFKEFQDAKNAPQKIQELVTKMEKKVDDIDKKLKDLGAK